MSKEPGAVHPEQCFTAHMAAELQARSVARAEALAYAKEVANLCALAGQPERTSVFMRAETPVADVRKKLTDANAVGKAAWGKAVQAVNMRMGFRKA